MSIKIFRTSMNASLATMVTIVLLFLGSTSAFAQSVDPEDSVLRIGVITGQSATGEAEGQTGTAFLVGGRRQVLTNAHVVAGARYILLGYLSSNGEPKLVPAQLTWKSEEYDLAVVTATEDLPQTPIIFAQNPMPRQNRPRDTIPRKGTEVTAIGFPAESDEISMTGQSEFDATSSYGRVQRVIPFAGNGRWIIQHSADIAPGNSGGPLVNECGELVGINTWENRQGTRNLATHSAEVENALRYANVTPRKAAVPCGAAPPSPTRQQAPAAKAKPAPSKAPASEGADDAKSRKAEEMTYKFGKTIGYLLPLALIGFLAFKLLRRLSSKSPESVPSAPVRHHSASSPPLPTSSAQSDIGNRPVRDAPLTAAAWQHEYLILSDADGSRLGRFGIESDIYEHGEIRLGRDPAQNQLVLSESTVSREHCRLFATDNGHLYVEDLGSSNGTYVNGRRCPSNEVAGPLRNGDRLKLGEATMVVNFK